ncbi:hypothetical protein [Streptomyces sp. MMS24-I29]|uniref:hypothetical protein n=1 Tax=Streptomyces sp. MMS24-I29 TaxID=3351480 RepID=UPI003C79A324
MNDKTTQTLQSQGSPILLLAHLHRSMPHLPTAGFTLHSHVPGTLEIKLHTAAAGELSALAAFEQWRTALGLGAPSPRRADGLSWVSVEGVVDDVPVKLTGFGSEAEVRAYTVVRDPASLVSVTPVEGGGLVVVTTEPRSSSWSFGVDAYRPPVGDELDPESSVALPPGALVWTGGSSAVDMAEADTLVAEYVAGLASTAVAA